MINNINIFYSINLYMSQLLEKLKINKNPERKKEFKVGISKPKEAETNKPVEIKTKIVDKTKEGSFDSGKFLETLNVKPKKVEPTKLSSIPSVKPVHHEDDDVGSAPKPVYKGPKIFDLKIKKQLEENKEKTKVKSKINKSATITALKAVKFIDKKYEDIISLEELGDIEDKLPKREKIEIPVSAYFMNNRENFVNFINSLLKKYKAEIKDESKSISCEKQQESTDYFVHQKIIRDYLFNYTPYRGLLIYHGLGAGKTCGSIAIAESLKTEKEIMILTPASLRSNYLKELKKCGDDLYKLNQYWEFIEDKVGIDILSKLSSIMNLDIEFVKKQKGIWFVNVKKEPNYDLLSANDKISLNNQIDEQIHSRYRFINYNGLRESSLNILSLNGEINPFTNKVIIIDEAHNFVSRIANKLKRSKSLSMRLYNFLMSAENCKIVFLTGTPLINYPNELGILFNMLRGYIKTWNILLDIKGTKKVDQEYFEKLLSGHKITDYVKYKPGSKELEITRNPLGFINMINRKKYNGIYLNEQGNISDDDFVKVLVSILDKEKISILGEPSTLKLYKALPDTLDDFKDEFMDGGDIINLNVLKRRILGLTSYFRSAQESLMPRYDSERNFHLVVREMDLYQLRIYENMRSIERDLEKEAAKKKKLMKNFKPKNEEDLYKEATSTYRIFSRAFCNFVFPESLVRPMPKMGNIIENLNEDDADNLSVKDKINNPDGLYTADDAEDLLKEEDEKIDSSYSKRIEEALEKLQEPIIFDNGTIEYPLEYKNLNRYSPKFAAIYDNIINNRGLHLVYSQFRTLEGIGIFSLVLKQNGFAEFKIIKNDKNEWIIDIKNEDIKKPKFALYTGTEDPIVKEIIRNIYNGEWKNVPTTIVEEISQIYPNNNYGEIINILMITAAGSEGIDLKNTRWVHIMEPYWHPVRIDQVIGRANRICSHIALPEEDRTVEAFLYLMTFNEQMIKGEDYVELRITDTSKKDDTKVITTDEALYEISNIKREINIQLLRSIKETSIDCSIHKNKSEPLQCFNFGKVEVNKFSYKPSISGQESDEIENINKKKITWVARAIKINGIKRIERQDTKEIYDYDEYMEAKEDDSIVLIPLGKIEIGPGGKPKFIPKN